MSKSNLNIALFHFVVLAMLAGCTSFNHLTVLPSDKVDGPAASECGSCHIVQFGEWAGSVHGQAFVNPGFQAEIAAEGGDECLGCHVPLEVRGGDTMPRSFHRNEGVTCISCHLSQGTTRGPHASSALFQPHPVQEADRFYLTVDVCAVCHGETYDEYQAVQAGRDVATCQECHAAERRRTASQGSNIFSNALVAFEDDVDTRSHDISLDAMPHHPAAFRLAVLGLRVDENRATVEVEVNHRLPHNLPTGTFGAKSIRLEVCFLRDGLTVGTGGALVCDEQQALMPGNMKMVTVDVKGVLTGADTLEVRVERHASPESKRPEILLAATSLPLPTMRPR